eukprot:1836289-Alexandrium_andersonii.AAC.1
MSASLVGSEMCIRDRLKGVAALENVSRECKSAAAAAAARISAAAETTAAEAAPLLSLIHI